jgi:hypothetical protein
MADVHALRRQVSINLASNLSLGTADKAELLRAADEDPLEWTALVLSFVVAHLAP